ncbi:50S ribosomal L24 [Pyrenophora seminiperda CCB06]|uniref:Large ribosomal subunit protein bL28m n=1 Tax=Pyrenophora seminiperda CCB06 TaxID=1302712 RepID=A0A3M7MA34_9PLEO|nr:50S ribosomal L24 [Pyrenophora seminiperda CCB06]
MPPWYQLLSGRTTAQRAVMRSAQSTQRTYATAEPAPVVKNPLQRRRGGDLGSHLPQNVIPKDAYIPAYPYGDYNLFKQANKGLYGHQMIRYGNNVSKETETKTRRNWKPNVLSKSLYSVALKKRIKLRVTAKILKVIDREGGLDEYLLKDNEARIKELGPMGWALRWTLMQRPEVIERLRADAAALGLDEATIDKQWPTPDMMAEKKATQVTFVGDMDSHHLSDLEFVETEDQQMWAPLNKAQRKLAMDEYHKILSTAKRYVARSLVDSMEEGIKVAFVRAKEREEATALRQARIAERYPAKIFTPEHLQEIREHFKVPHITDLSAKNLAIHQWKQKEINDAGGLEAWKAAKGITAKIAAAGGEEAMRAQNKAKFAHLLKEAESASANEEMEPERRAYLQNAMRKADIVIKAMATTPHGKKAYQHAIWDHLRNDFRSQSTSTSKGESARGGKRESSDTWHDISRASRGEKYADGDAWDALVDSSNNATESRART